MPTTTVSTTAAPPTTSEEETSTQNEVHTSTPLAEEQSTVNVDELTEDEDDDRLLWYRGDTGSNCAIYFIEGDPYPFNSWVSLDCNDFDHFVSDEVYYRKVKGKGPVSCDEGSIATELYMFFFNMDMKKLELRCRELDLNYYEIKSKTTVELDSANSDIQNVTCPEKSVLLELETKKVDYDRYNIKMVCIEYDIIVYTSTQLSTTVNVDELSEDDDDVKWYRIHMDSNCAIYKIIGDPYPFNNWVNLKCHDFDYFVSDDVYYRKVKGKGPVSCDEGSIATELYMFFYKMDMKKLELRCRELDPNSYEITSKTTVELDSTDSDTESVICPGKSVLLELETKKVDYDRYDLKMVCIEYKYIGNNNNDYYY